MMGTHLTVMVVVQLVQLSQALSVMVAQRIDQTFVKKFVVMVKIIIVTNATYFQLDPDAQLNAKFNQAISVIKACLALQMCA